MGSRRRFSTEVAGEVLGVHERIEAQYELVAVADAQSSALTSREAYNSEQAADITDRWPKTAFRDRYDREES